MSWETQPYALWACSHCGKTDRWAILPPGTQLVCTGCRKNSFDFQVAPATAAAIFETPQQHVNANPVQENNVADMKVPPNKSG